MLFSKGEQKNLSEMSFNENDILEDILEESEFKMNSDYSNEVYGNLMSLVTKYKLSNAMGNAIIKFFNKHTNLNTSPLSKSIEKECKYMDNMNLLTLTFTKTLVKNYKNKEYYLHYQSLINCIKNILSISNISQNFALTFEKLEVIMSVMQQLCL